MTRLFILLIPVVLFLFPKETHSVQKEATTMTDVGKISINIQEDGQTVPARIRFLDSEGECVIPEGAIGYQRSKSFVCDGETSIEAPAGKYRLEVLRGTEYKPFVTDVVLEAGRSHSVTAEMDRWIDMNALGWYSGDLHVHWPVEEVPLLMRAVELNLCTIQSLWNENSFWKEKALPSSLVREVDPSHLFHVLSAEDERDGGAVLIFGLEKPIDLTSVSKYFPSSLGYVEKAHAQGAWIEQEKPFWWESPVNVALGGVLSTELANNHFCEEWMLENEAWGRPRDADKYPGLLGYALNCFDIYYHYLNAGFKLIATAGSATGVLPNPLGYNRCYVDCGEEFSYHRWFERLRECRSFVTNGPMLFVKAGGSSPGDPIPAGTESVDISVEAVAATVVEKVEVIGDGRILAEFVPEKPASRLEWETTVPLDKVSWLAVRCFEPAEGTIRFAHSGPIYVHGKTSPHLREAAHFFLKWIDDLSDRAKDDPSRYETEEQKAEILGQYRAARQVYEKIAGAQ